MSLFSSLNLARLALGAHQTAIQTVGQNIANAATEGYARQRVQMTPTPSDDLVFARLGTGVRVSRIERVVDEHLESTLRDSRSDLANLTEQTRIWSLTESIFNDLDGGGLSQSLGRFFDAVQDLAVNRPVEMDGAVATAHRPVEGLELGSLEHLHALGQVVRDEGLAVGVEQPIGLLHLVEHDHALGRPSGGQALLHELHVEQRSAGSQRHRVAITKLCTQSR